MQDEVAAMMDNLMHTIGIITHNKGDELQRIADAYWEAQELVASIDLDSDGSARPRIIACFGQFNTYKAANDVAAAGWMLMAIQQRIYEQTFPDWERLKIIVDSAVALLPRPTVH